MIYMVAIDDHGLCKIGSALDVERRVASLQTASPFVLRLVKTRDGGADLERAIHRSADHLRVRGEWFKLTPEIVCIFDDALIASAIGERTHRDILRKAGHDPIAALTGRPITTVRSWDQRVSRPADLWLTIANAGHANLDELAENASRKRADQGEAA